MQMKSIQSKSNPAACKQVKLDPGSMGLDHRFYLCLERIGDFHDLRYRARNSAFRPELY